MPKSDDPSASSSADNITRAKPGRTPLPAVSDAAASEEVMASQTIASWNELWAWMRELDRLLRTPVEEAGLGSAAAR